jgi:phosphate transport system substrate-binding protein
VSEVGAQALLPNSFSVATEDYVLSRRLFLYTSIIPSHPWTTAFTEFALSDEGQKLVDESGFISQQVGIETVLTSDKMPERYQEITKTAEGRLSLSFRFRSGKTQMDAKAARDLERVVRLLARPENRRKQVCLLGFSDQSGNRSSNLKLSEERAKEISAQLALRGVPVAEVLAMGSEMPVASNDTKSGQEKNRRVEIWVGSL